MRRLAPLLLLIAAGCGTTVSTTFSSVGEGATVEPGASATPLPPGDAEEATITLVNIGAVDGPGTSIADAIARAGAGAMTDGDLVNGNVLLKDAEGRVWLCDSLAAGSPPACAEPRLLVTNFPTNVGDFDPANAGVTGLQQDGEVLWLEGAHQLFGTVTASP